MRSRVFRQAVLVLSAAAWLPFFAGPARAEEEGALKESPRIKAPAFPLEPNKKPAQPIDPKTYVEAPDEPPPPESDRAIARKGREPGQWWSSLELGWFYASHTAKHSFTTSGTQTVRTLNANPLSLMGRLELWPPGLPISFGLELAGTTGTAEATSPDSSLGRIQFTSQDARGVVGIRIHPLKRTVAHDLRLGADFEGSYTTFTTLTSNQASLDTDNRILALVIPRLEYRYSKNPNWAAHLGVGYAAALKASGAGDVIGKPYRRLDLDARALRYLAPGNAIGVGAYYASEKVTWTQSVPAVLTDEMTSTDFRLNLFWRSDF